MKARPTQLDTLSVRRAEVANGKQVRYRVYQSPSEYIAVIAESALLAMRLSGVQNPYKIVRDIPTSGAAIEKGQVSVPESAEKVPLATEKLPYDFITFNPPEEEAVNPFVEMPLLDIFKKRTPSVGVLSREKGMDMFGVSQDAPTLQPAPAAKVAAEPAIPQPPIAAPDPEPKADEGVLSQDDIAKLLGDA